MIALNIPDSFEASSAHRLLGLLGQLLKLFEQQVSLVLSHVTGGGQSLMACLGMRRKHWGSKGQGNVVTPVSSCYGYVLQEGADLDVMPRIFQDFLQLLKWDRVWFTSYRFISR